MNDKKTEICISISSSPGTFGETVHNAGYKYHKLNYLYKAIKAIQGSFKGYIRLDKAT